MHCTTSGLDNSVLNSILWSKRQNWRSLSLTKLRYKKHHILINGEWQSWNHRDGCVSRQSIQDSQCCNVRYTNTESQNITSFSVTHTHTHCINLKMILKATVHYWSIQWRAGWLTGQNFDWIWLGLITHFDIHIQEAQQCRNQLHTACNS